MTSAPAAIRTRPNPTRTRRNPKRTRHNDGQLEIVKVTYVDDQGWTMTLDPDPVAAQDFAPTIGMRKIPRHAGSSNTPGRLWTRTTDDHQPYESHLESQWVLLMDYDPAIAHIVTQPLLIQAADTDGTLFHTPDVFIRRHDGTASIVDVTIPQRRHTRRVVRCANATAFMCSQLQWNYHLVTIPPEQMTENVGWLSACRRLEPNPDLVDRLLQACETPTTLNTLWDANPPALLSKPATFHLLWNHLLEFDPTAPLNGDTLVWRSP